MTSLSKLERFVERVRREMREQGKIPADIARSGIVSDAAVSKLFGLQQKTVGYKMMWAISEALDIPLEVVQDWAGYEVDKKSAGDEITKIAQHLFSSYQSDETRQRALSFLRHLADEEKKNARNGSPSQKRTSTTKTP